MDQKLLLVSYKSKKIKQKKPLKMNEKQSITNYIYSKLQEAKKIPTEGKPVKPPKAKKPAKKPPTDPKPAAPPAPHWLDSPEHKARRQERALNRARLAHRSLRAEFKALSPEEQEKQEPEFEKQFQYWRDSLNEQQQYIADFVKNLLKDFYDQASDYIIVWQNRVH